MQLQPSFRSADSCDSTCTCTCTRARMYLYKYMYLRDILQDVKGRYECGQRDTETALEGEVMEEVKKLGLTDDRLAWGKFLETAHEYGVVPNPPTQPSRGWSTTRVRFSSSLSLHVVGSAGSVELLHSPSATRFVIRPRGG